MRSGSRKAAEKRRRARHPVCTAGDRTCPPGAEPGDERPCFIDGRPVERAGLPIPEDRIVVGLDGGHARDWDERKAHFELIVGRCMPDERQPRYLDLVHGYDPKPKRRLLDLLKEQGVQANQDVTLLTGGGEEVRSLTELVTPEAERGRPLQRNRCPRRPR